MKRLILVLSMIVSLNATAQSDFDRSVDQNGSIVYKGQFSFEDLNTEPSFDWMKSGAASYTPDTTAVKFLKKHLPGYELVIFLGTWCSDSHELVPKLYKTLQASAYPSSYTMYGLDRAKEAKNIEHKLYRIDLVPVVVLMQNHREIGRITEAPQKSIEKDLQRLIQQDLDQQ